MLENNYDLSFLDVLSTQDKFSSKKRASTMVLDQFDKMDRLESISFPLNNPIIPSF